ncbi:MAG: DUF4230 domain-containing protein [Lentisphaerae bacterium]|nr:DUF4230 domain-containing protein [Lentisphaerota bacterium]
MGDDLLLIVLTALATLAGAGWATTALRRRRPAPALSIQSGLQNLRAVGHLSVFKAVTREIVTETDHTWGELGKKYLSWILSTKKMAMIFEFEIDFRYDLRRPEFDIVPAADGSVVVRMPPCHHDARIRDIRFYDEQRSRLLPWLLPDLVNGFLSGGFTEEDKNRLVSAAKAHAEAQARSLIDNLQPEVQASAKATLQSLARAFGVEKAVFDFSGGGAPEITVEVARPAAA